MGCGKKQKKENDAGTAGGTDAGEPEKDAAVDADVPDGGDDGGAGDGGIYYPLGCTGDIVFGDDGYVESAVEFALGVPEGTPLYFDDVSGITVLDLSDLDDVVDLTGIQCLVGLTTLDLSFTYTITDVAPLSGLVKLTWLDLQVGYIIDIGPLSGLVNLTWLNLNYNDIVDIGPLVDNLGLATGDSVFFVNNDLDCGDWDDIQTLVGRGVSVDTDVIGPCP
jgi:hypothetical protein